MSWLTIFFQFICSSYHIKLITMQNCNIFFITGRLSTYGYCFLEHLRKPEIIHAEFPLKTISAMNSITLVQFTPLTKLKGQSLNQDYYSWLEQLLQKDLWIKIKIWKLMLLFRTWKMMLFPRSRKFSTKLILIQFQV